MSETWRWRDAIAATAHLQTHETERQVLLLVLQLPFLDASLAARLIGRKSRTAVYRSLAILQSTGLLAAIRPPLQSGHSPSLFYLTDLGLATLALDRDCEPVDLAGHNGVRRVDLRRLLLGLPYLRATYAMLGALVGPVGDGVELLVWERPWRRRFWRPTAKVPVTLGVPAGVTLRRGSETQTVLLFPDVGTIPLRAYREMVQRLFAYRRARGNLPRLAIATGDERRAGAWARLLGDVQRHESEAPLDVSVTTWAELEASPLTLGGGSRVEPTSERTQPAGQRETLGVPWRPRRPAGALPRIVGEAPGIGESDPAVRAVAELTPAERGVLALIGQHPFLPTRRLATLVGATSAVTLRRRNFLLARGLLRLVESGELSPEFAAAELVELTVPGLTLVAAQLGLSLAGAVRWSGLAGGGPSAPVGARRKLISQLAHTLGADALFISLVATARRRHATRGGDDQLLEWRNAASCSRRHLRPDGYGIYRHDGHLYGFFLEYDRGTMSARDYRQKFDAYYDYWTSGQFERDYDGFPTILIVTTDYAAEGRLAKFVCAASVGRGALLPALLTSEWRILRDPSNPDGLLGPIWRTPDSPPHDRRFWPLGRSPTALDATPSSRAVPYPTDGKAVGPSLINAPVGAGCRRIE
jgi:hypothetical protein